MTSLTSVPAQPMPHRRSAPSRRASGFSMVELITVIGIIALLATITVVGLKYVGGNAKKRETETRLQRLRNGLSEVAGTPAGRTRLNQVIIPQVFRDFAPGDDWDAVPASSQNSLFKTGQLIKLFSANPGFRKIIDDLPLASKRAIIFNLTDNGGSNKPWTIAEPAPSKPFDVARYVEYTLPLDSWDNPLVFVYDNWEITGQGGIGVRKTSTTSGKDTGGLSDLYSDANKTYWTPTTVMRVTEQSLPATDSKAYGYTKDMATSNRTTYIRAGEAFRNDADRTSFWFSAGADGKYQTHDDNVYSFGDN